MQQPPQLLMIKYRSSLLRNFLGKRLLDQKDEKLLGSKDLQEIAICISCDAVSSCLPKRHCSTGYVWKAKYVFLFPEKWFLLLQCFKDSENIAFPLSHAWGGAQAPLMPLYHPCSQVSVSEQLFRHGRSSWALCSSPPLTPQLSVWWRQQMSDAMGCVFEEVMR